MNSSLLHAGLSSGPTTALPGSEEKIRVLAQRARLGVPLWHPLDARLPLADRRSTMGVLEVLAGVHEGEAQAMACLVKGQCPISGGE